MSDDPGTHIAKLYEEVSFLKGMVERMHRPGPVTDVDYSDATKPRVRIQIGTDADGKPVKGPWLPVASHAGARAVHAPVSVGQTMMQLSPDGNFESGLLIPFGFSKLTPSPSTDSNTAVDEFGKIKLSITKDTWTLEAEGVSIALSKNKVSIKAGSSTWVIQDGKIVSTATTIAEVGSVFLGSESASRPLALEGSIDSAGDAELGNLATKVMGL